VSAPRVVDNDRDEITVTLDGKELRGWSYESETERRTKMLAAREFCEGWFQAMERAAILRSALSEIAERHIPDQPAAYGGTELDWAVRQYAALRATASAALAQSTA